MEDTLSERSAVDVVPLSVCHFTMQRRNFVVNSLHTDDIHQSKSSKGLPPKWVGLQRSALSLSHCH